MDCPKLLYQTRRKNPLVYKGLKDSKWDDSYETDTSNKEMFLFGDFNRTADMDCLLLALWWRQKFQYKDKINA